MTLSSPLVSLDQIIKAHRDIHEGIVITPTVFSPALSHFTGARIFCKHEHLQRTGSFKDRGALNKMLSLSPDQQKRGVITMSAGNHAQGVAYHAERLGIPATILMPQGTPSTKINRTASYGASIILEGSNLSELEPLADSMIQSHGFTLVHPFDDPLIVNGQGTVGIEILDAVPDLDVIVVPIGGGGIISGIAVAAKTIKPDISIIGVEADLYASMTNAVKKANHPIGGDTLAEGIAVKRPGDLTIPLINELVDDIILLNETQIEQGVSDLFQQGRIVAEGSGAAPLAAVRSQPKKFADKNVALVICGANIDERILSSVFTRSLIRQKIISHLSIDIRDIPGTLASITSIISKHDGNILEVTHKRSLYDYHVKHAVLNVILETRGAEILNTIINEIKSNGFTLRIIDE